MRMGGEIDAAPTAVLAFVAGFCRFLVAIAAVSPFMGSCITVQYAILAAGAICLT